MPVGPLYLNAAGKNPPSLSWSCWSTGDRFRVLRSIRAQLLTDNVHVPRSINPEPNSVRTDPDDRNGDFVADENSFAWLP